MGKELSYVIIGILEGVNFLAAEKVYLSVSEARLQDGNFVLLNDGDTEFVYRDR